MTDVSPMLKWTTAIIAGGGVAGVTQGVTALLRAKSTDFLQRALVDTATLNRVACD